MGSYTFPLLCLFYFDCAHTVPSEAGGAAEAGMWFQVSGNEKKLLNITVSHLKVEMNIVP